MRRIALVLTAAMLTGAPAHAQLMDILTAPKTLIDRAIEARSASDIAKDNVIVAKVNGYMGKEVTIKASTEIYEQRLLVTGLFDDKATYDQFQRDVRSVEGVKKLYWHVTYLPKNDPRRQSLPAWADTIAMGAKAQGRLIGTKGVADVNFRTTVDIPTALSMSSAAPGHRRRPTRRWRASRTARASRKLSIISMSGPKP